MSIQDDMKAVRAWINDRAHPTQRGQVERILDGYGAMEEVLANLASEKGCSYCLGCAACGSSFGTIQDRANEMLRKVGGE
jgi:hypothetical protein